MKGSPSNIGLTFLPAPPALPSASLSCFARFFFKARAAAIGSPHLFRSRSSWFILASSAVLAKEVTDSLAISLACSSICCLWAKPFPHSIGFSSSAFAFARAWSANCCSDITRPEASRITVLAFAPLSVGSMALSLATFASASIRAILANSLPDCKPRTCSLSFPLRRGGERSASSCFIAPRLGGLRSASFLPLLGGLRSSCFTTRRGGERSSFFTVGLDLLGGD
mmetsp:Transcript_30129/g.42015  ORF Transcript_30129/g.42015 Transcript_30129/m.42015 type:complete len:225 (+) Transcript_30129:273-947(+)